MQLKRCNHRYHNITDPARGFSRCRSAAPGFPAMRIPSEQAREAHARLQLLGKHQARDPRNFSHGLLEYEEIEAAHEVDNGARHVPGLLGDGVSDGFGDFLG